MNLKHRILPYLILVLTTLIWSTNFIIGKALTGIPPLLLATARFSVAAVIFVFLLYVRGEKIPRGTVWRSIFLMGFTGIFIFNPLLYLGLHYTTSINATIINSFNPLMIALVSFFWLSERLSKLKLLGLALSILGIGWIAIQGTWSNLEKLQFNSGDLLIILDTLVWAIYTVVIKRAADKLTTAQSAAFPIFAGLLFLLPATAVENIYQPLPSLSLSVGVALVYLGLFPSVVAYLLWNRAVAEVGPTQAGIFYNLIPVFNILLALPLLHEQLLRYHVIGGLFIITGIILASVPTPDRGDKVPSPDH